MRKLILGIIVVFWLDFGFVVYNGDSVEMIAAMPDGALSTSSVSVPYDEGTLVATHAPETEDVAFSTITGPAPGRERHAARPRASRPAVLEPTLSRVAVNNIATRTASHKVAGPLGGAVFTPPSFAGAPSDRTRAKYEPAAENRSARPKKSFFAKVVPIVTKPYDWLKAVASKLK